MTGSEHDARVDARLRSRISESLHLLAVDPPVARRPLPAVRAQRRRGPLVLGLAAALVVMATVGGLAAVRDRGAGEAHSPLARATALPSRVAAEQPGTLPSAPSHPSGVAGGPGRAAGAADAAPAPPTCQYGANGGSTAPGVTRNRIQLGTALALSGPMAAVGERERDGMLAALNAVNRNGGICGRELFLSVVDDRGDATLGRQATDTYISGGQTFALLAPSPAGLAAAIRGGDLDRAGMPVIGYDASAAPVLDDPWAWPVLSPPVSMARAMAHDAARRGARTYAFVYDTTLPGAAAFAGAFEAQVQRDGGTVPSGCMVRIDGGAPSSNPQYQGFQQSCGAGRSDGGVDFVGFALGPSAQQQWASEAQGDLRAYWGVRPGGGGEGAGSTTALMASTDLTSCGSWCGHVWSWGATVPDDAPFSGTAPMQEFISACAAQGPQCDAADPHTQAGYAAVQLAVAALRAVGPDVTRTALRAYLDGATFDDGVLQPLSFSRGTHLGAQEMRPVVATTFDQAGNPESFAWAAPPLTDPCPRCSDPPAS